MKTENKKFENPISKTFAVVLSLVLISLTVSANGFWKQILVNNTYGKMAIMMVDQENKNNELLALASTSLNAKSSETISNSDFSFIETAQDKKIEFESWMTNESNFVASLFNDQLINDKPLEIEEWMIENPNFMRSSDTNESEPALKIEAWMTNDAIWAN